MNMPNLHLKPMLIAKINGSTHVWRFKNEASMIRARVLLRLNGNTFCELSFAGTPYMEFTQRSEYEAAIRQGR